MSKIYRETHIVRTMHPADNSNILFEHEEENPVTAYTRWQVVCGNLTALEPLAPLWSGGYEAGSKVSLVTAAVTLSIRLYRWSGCAPTVPLYHSVVRKRLARA